VTFETVGTEERDGARVADIRIEVGPADATNENLRAAEPIEAYLGPPGRFRPDPLVDPARLPR
jgi:hypothetical protein